VNDLTIQLYDTGCHLSRDIGLEANLYEVQFVGKDSNDWFDPLHCGFSSNAGDVNLKIRHSDLHLPNKILLAVESAKSA
jgi:hypothetical protein